MSLTKSALFGAIIAAILTLIASQDIRVIFISPNPYIIAACFLGVYLGMWRSISAAIVLSVAYYFVYKQTLDPQEVESMLSVRTLYMPISIIILSALAGAVTDNIRNERTSYFSELQNTQGTLKKITDLNKQLQEERHEIERRVITRLQTASTFFNHAFALESSNLKEVCTSLNTIVQEQTGIDNSFIYIVHEDSLVLQASPEGDSTTMPKVIHKQSLNQYPVIEYAYKTASLARPDQVELMPLGIPGEWGVAAPMCGPEGRVLGLIVLRDVDFLNYIPVTFSNLESIARWGAMVVARVYREKDLEKWTFHDIITGLYTHEYYKQRVKSEFLQAQTYGQPLSVFTLDIKNISSLNPNQRMIMLKLLANHIIGNKQEQEEITLGNKEGSFRLICWNPDSRSLGDLQESISAKIGELSSNLKIDENLSLEANEISNKEQDLLNHLKTENIV
jgi:hypothetical protein